MNKKSLSERDICTKFITPALQRSGWDIDRQIREEVTFTNGRIIVKGKLVARGNIKRADYILFHKPNIPIAIIEAKDNNHSIGDGMQQALVYADILDIPFSYSSNGDGFLEHDRTKLKGKVESELSLDNFPSPSELWQRYKDSKKYNRKDFDKNLVLEKRTEIVAKKVSDFFKKNDSRYDKSIFFCVDIEHAERMRQALVNENADLSQKNSKYIMRITGDNEEGKAQLDNFIYPDSRYPVHVTTSKLMTTGVDCQTCKYIILDSNINSMTEFKQIIGRGTRVREDYDKYYFTIIDFRGVTRLFADPAFDGDPVKIKETDGDIPTEDEDTTDEDGGVEGIEYTGDSDDKPEFPDDRVKEAPRKYYVNDVEVKVINERVLYYDKDGKLITESLTDFTKKTVQKQYATLDEFLKRWNASQRKQSIVDELAKQGFLFDELREEVGKELDPFDLICHVVYDMPPLTRHERANNVRKRNYFTKYGEQAQAVIEALLNKYENEGLKNLEDIKILKVNPFDKFGSPIEIVNIFGGKDKYINVVKELEKELYVA